MWEHIRSHHRYTEIVNHSPETLEVRAKSATTGRWVKVNEQMLRQITTPDEVLAAEEFVRREHLQHLAWQLSRELPYNLGTAVTNIALSGHGGNLVVALGALRDEIERSHVASDATTSEETNE